MMSIVVNGHVHRTLDQPIYLSGGTQVKEAYRDGVLVYPDDVPLGRYGLKVSGAITVSFVYGREYEHVFGGVIYDDKYHIETSRAVMTGKVTVTVVSKNPIRVYEGPIPWNLYAVSTSDPRGCFNSEYSGYNKTNSNGSHPKGSYRIFVPEFPVVQSAVAYQGNFCTSEQDLFECPSTTHVKLSASGTNSAYPTIYSNGSNFASYSRLDIPYGANEYSSCQSLTYERWYHGNASSGALQLSTRSTNSDRPSVSAGIPADFIHGFELYARVSSLSGGAGVFDPVPSIGVRLISYIPLTKLEYNNNPPMSSPTFANDPPTEELPSSFIESM